MMLENLKPPETLRPCRIGRILESLEDKDRAILQNALDDVETWGANTLAKQLGKVANIKTADGTITKHRQKGCICYRA